MSSPFYTLLLGLFVLVLFILIIYPWFIVIRTTRRIVHERKQEATAEGHASRWKGWRGAISISVVFILCVLLASFIASIFLSLFRHIFP